MDFSTLIVFFDYINCFIFCCPFNVQGKKIREIMQLRRKLRWLSKCRYVSCGEKELRFTVRSRSHHAR